MKSYTMNEGLSRKLGYPAIGIHDEFPRMPSGRGAPILPPQRQGRVFALRVDNPNARPGIDRASTTFVNDPRGEAVGSVLARTSQFAQGQQPRIPSSYARPVALPAFPQTPRLRILGGPGGVSQQELQANNLKPSQTGRIADYQTQRDALARKDAYDAEQNALFARTRPDPMALQGLKGEQKLAQIQAQAAATKEAVGMRVKAIEDRINADMTLGRESLETKRGIVRDQIKQDADEAAQRSADYRARGDDMMAMAKMQDAVELYSTAMRYAPVTRETRLDQAAGTLTDTTRTDTTGITPPTVGNDAADRAAVASGQSITAGLLADADGNGVVDNIESQYRDMTDVEAEKIMQRADTMKDRMAVAVAKALLAKRDKLAKQLVNPEAQTK